MRSSTHAGSASKGLLFAALIAVIASPVDSRGAAADDPAKPGGAVRNVGIEVLPWPKDEAPGRFMGGVKLVRLSAATEAILLTSFRAGRTEQPTKPVKLNSAKEACEYLTRNVNMGCALACVWVCEQPGEEALYVFSGGDTARRVDDFSRGLILSASGKLSAFAISWEFLDALNSALKVKEDVRRSERVAPKIDWKPVEQDIARSPNAELGNWKRTLEELWKAIAAHSDYGMMCQKPCVFEELLREELKRRVAAGRAGRSLCLYLMTTELPAWCPSVCYVAAGVLAGEGDPRGMAVLLDGLRAVNQREPRPVVGDWELREAASGAQTEHALPLWKTVLEKEDAKARLWAQGNIAAVAGDGAAALLVLSLKDDDYAVRKCAALHLMARDRKEAVPVLRELLSKELGTVIQDADTLAPICAKLEQWKVSDVPWGKLEAHLTDGAKRESHACWRAVTIAGHCLGAGRGKVAEPFLKDAMLHPEEQVALYAARTLVENGSPLGIDHLAKYISSSTKQSEWYQARDALVALGRFLLHPRCTAEHREKIMAVARTAFARRDALFGGYGYRLIEALGEMGALCRVAKADGRLTVDEFIQVSYDGHQPGYALEYIYQARIRSVVVSAKQQGIELPADWLAQFEAGELAALSRIAKPGSPAARAVEDAIKRIRAGKK